MKIKVTLHVDVPISPYCGKCTRKEQGKNGHTFCTLYNRYLYIRRGNWLKCFECYTALYDAIDKEG
jgi:hypothetical protein